MTPETQALARLQSATWLQDGRLQKFFAVLDGDKGATRAVGGAVRDTLLDCLPDRVEIDFATQLTPDEVTARATEAGLNAVPTGIDFGTVTLVHEGLSVEVTTLREDVETDGRWAKVCFGTDWREDALRRDFTLNALYCGPDGSLFDPLGGLEDCLERRIRFIGDPAQRIAEDRLRVYRFFRFSASHGGQRFDSAGLAACTEAAGELHHLSAERVGQEMIKMLNLPMVWKTLLTMSQCGIVELDAETLDWLALYEAATDTPAVAGRLALLGRKRPLEAYQEDWRLSNAQVSTAKEVQAAAELLAQGQVNRAVYRYGEKAALAVPVAAALGHWEKSWRSDMARAVAATHPPAFPVSGKDLMAQGFLPGPRMGHMLDRLETAWIESDFKLTRDQLLARARE